MVPQMLVFFLLAKTNQKSRREEILDLSARWRFLDAPSRNQVSLHLEDEELEGSVATQMREGREDFAMWGGRETFGHEIYIRWKNGHRGYVSPCEASEDMYI